MVYFANFDTFNFCLRGTTNLNCSSNAQGMFNGSFVSCFGWPYWNTQGINQGKSSWSAYIFQCQIPYVNTFRTSNTNLKIDSHLRFQGRPFGLNLTVANSKIASVFFSGSNPPQVAAPTSGTFMAGYHRVGLSSRGNSVGIGCNLVYGASFANWRLNSASGTVVTSNQNTNLFFGSNYGGVNFKDIKGFFASGF